MKFILGEKVGMTQIFDKNGNVVPVTLVHATKNVVTQVRRSEKEGYTAVQVGQGETRKNNKAKQGHLKGLGNMRTLKEFRMEKTELNRGDAV